MNLINKFFQLFIGLLYSSKQISPTFLWVQKYQFFISIGCVFQETPQIASSLLSVNITNAFSCMELTRTCLPGPTCYGNFFIFYDFTFSRNFNRIRLHLPTYASICIVLYSMYILNKKRSNFKIWPKCVKLHILDSSRYKFYRVCISYRLNIAITKLHHSYALCNFPLLVAI